VNAKRSTTGVSKEANPAKFHSLIEKIFCAPPSKKMKRNFAGFAPPSGGEPLGGIPQAKRAVNLPIFRNFW